MLYEYSLLTIISFLVILYAIIVVSMLYFDFIETKKLTSDDSEIVVAIKNGALKNFGSQLNNVKHWYSESDDVYYFIEALAEKLIDSDPSMTSIGMNFVNDVRDEWRKKKGSNG